MRSGSLFKWDATWSGRPPLRNLLDLYQPEILHTPEVAAEGQPIPGVGRLAALLHRLRSVLQGLYRGYHGGPESSNFCLLNPQFPHSLRYSVDCLRQALVAVQHSSGRAPVDELTRISGRLQASLSFVEVSDILAQDAGAYLHNILQQCRQTHDLIYRFYIQYSVEAALAM